LSACQARPGFDVARVIRVGYIAAMHACCARLRRTRSAGFTLVELMVVVAITGILATIGISLVRGHLNVAKSNRALAGVQAIRAAEESFRAQNGSYLDCSGVTAAWFPMLTPGQVKYEWHQTSHADWPRWATLGVPAIDSTQFGFLVNAGKPGDPYPVLQTADKPTLSASADPWYVIQVKGDVDGDGVFMLGFATSRTGDVYLEREGE
jgi:prepilin-type N-terminal cleavage/methylation domain-containing protein